MHLLNYVLAASTWMSSGHQSPHDQAQTPGLSPRNIPRHLSHLSGWQCLLAGAPAKHGEAALTPGIQSVGSPFKLYPENDHFSLAPWLPPWSDDMSTSLTRVLHLDDLDELLPSRFGLCFLRSLLYTSARAIVSCASHITSLCLREKGKGSVWWTEPHVVQCPAPNPHYVSFFPLLWPPWCPGWTPTCQVYPCLGASAQLAPSAWQASPPPRYLRG